ncbi:cytochrome c oxidase subunit NDUFA4 isoform X2 [Hydra vulgaris]|uniref:Cytochrome c oxidase subunit NDUFA4 isoform X2 n=1 Tax=Hydra vulgaris TaxID=6087 RepID=A0ABM4CVE3_HYDVU
MNFRKHLMLPELMPLFACVGAGMCMAACYTIRLATKGPEVTWSRVKNPEPWQNIPFNKSVKFYTVNDYSKLTPPVPNEALEAIKGI